MTQKFAKLEIGNSMYKKQEDILEWHTRKIEAKKQEKRDKRLWVEKEYMYSLSNVRGTEA